MLDNKKVEEIRNKVWATYETFRGVMNAAEFMDFILPLLFLKYVSDVWKDHYAELKKRFGDDENQILECMEHERFVLPKGKSFDDLHGQRNANNIGMLIDAAIDAIKETNKTKLDGVFCNISYNSKAKFGTTHDRNQRLEKLLDDFAKIDLRPSQVSEAIVGEAYINIIERFAMNAGKNSGEFYTPRQVARLLAKLAAPQPGDLICDPACGSGSLLIRAGEEISDKNFALFGQELNANTCALARMNMILHGIDNARIELGDTLKCPKLVNDNSLMKFDVVLANPPFSFNIWGAENAEADRYARFWRGVPPKSKGDYAFISHMVEVAKARKGRVAVVVPHGVLFRGAAEGRIRQKLVEENLLDAVIGLPQNLFPTTSIPVAILVFDRSREHGGANESRTDVVFIDASREFQPGKYQNALLDEHVDNIVVAYRSRKNMAKFVRAVSIREIGENDFNLNIPNYVNSLEGDEETDVTNVQKEIEELEIELAEVRAKMRKYPRELGDNT